MPASPVPRAGRELYRGLARRKVAILGVMAAALLLSFCVDLAWGPARLGLGEVIAALLHPAQAPPQVRAIVWDIRMPAAVMAVVVGAALSLAGAQMQTILANPLASPFTLGISAAASFGAAMAIVTGVALVPVNAFLMALLATLFIFFFAQIRGVSVQTMILLGIALVFAFNAALAFMQFLASEAALATVVFWTMGSLIKATWLKIGVTAGVLAAVLPLFVRHAWALTAMRLGDDKAASFGVNVVRLRLETMVLVSLLAAVPVSFVGAIGAAGRRAIAYMPQDSAANAVRTVYESILLARKQGQGWAVEDDDLGVIDTIMAALNIAPLAFRDLGELSGGQRQLVAIAQALAREPRIMLLDEPTSALDLHRQIEVLDFMRDQARRQGRVVLIALHDLNQALRFADRLLVIAQGHMVAYGPPVEVLSAGLLREVWRVQARIEPCSRGCPQIIVDGTVR